MLALRHWLGRHSPAVSFKYLLVKTEKVRSSEELEAELDGNVHIWDILAVAVLVPVVEILNHLVKNHGTTRRAKNVSIQRHYR